MVLQRFEALPWDEAELGQAAFWAATLASQPQLEALVCTPLALFAGALKRCYQEAEAAGVLKRPRSEGAPLDFEPVCPCQGVFTACASTIGLSAWLQRRVVPPTVAGVCRHLPV